PTSVEGFGFGMEVLACGVPFITSDLPGVVEAVSDAALTVLGALTATRPLAVLKAVPRVVRDPVYDLIARNRYAVFGRTDACMVPSAEDRDRFIA
ncbi:MAG: DCC1-like thiol-disulfide oxidoreductase family protein, partial [Brevundimonas sp.]|nr:DCC1-like thiol-disulfide oxidoreductase family protein [Brevundimonas sp.]